MHGPLIFIATNRLKPGRLDSERARVPGLVEFVEANEPRVIAFNEYVNDAGDEVSVVQIWVQPVVATEAPRIHWTVKWCPASRRGLRPPRGSLAARVMSSCNGRRRPLRPARSHGVAPPSRPPGSPDRRLRTAPTNRRRLLRAPTASRKRLNLGAEPDREH